MFFVQVLVLTVGRRIGGAGLEPGCVWSRSVPVEPQDPAGAVVQKKVKRNKYIKESIHIYYFVNNKKKGISSDFLKINKKKENYVTGNVLRIKMFHSLLDFFI